MPTTPMRLTAPALALAAALGLAACASPTAPAPDTAAGQPPAAPTTVAAATAPAAATPPAAARSIGATDTAAMPAKLNLNSATAEDFLAIPGVGPRMVREFEEYRPYASIVAFREEMGKYVEPAQVAEYEKYVYVPVRPNEADEATLGQLPGVSPAVAAQLVGLRPFASNAAFLEALAGLVSAQDAAAAAAYLDQP